MPFATKYLFVVSMDVAKDKEALFNEVYDTEHVPELKKVPGVRAVTRLKTEPAAFNEIDSPAVLLSKEWAEAGEKGRWAKDVRPYTTNRRHIVRKVI